MGKRKQQEAEEEVEEDLEDKSEESEQDYPPWMTDFVAEDANLFNEVVVVADDAKDKSRRDWVRCKVIKIPDTQDAAAQKPPGECRIVTIQEGSTILLAAGPLDPPYVGLVEKIWRKASAKPEKKGDGSIVYRLSDFGVECYWFYRPQEVPKKAWKRGMKKPQTPGRAQYSLNGKSLIMEEYPERQVLFSSHHTLHDYPGDDGILTLDLFIQECKMHWLGLSKEPPLRYSVHGGQLIHTLEPGFIVRGFLWCNSKKEHQFPDANKEVHPLDGNWQDPPTMQLARKMLKSYKEEELRIAKRNQHVVDKFKQAQDTGVKSPPSDSGEDWPQEATATAGARKNLQQRSVVTAPAPGQVKRPPSPRLPGIDSDDEQMADANGRPQKHYDDDDGDDD